MDSWVIPAWISRTTRLPPRWSYHSPALPRDRLSWLTEILVISCHQPERSSVLMYFVILHVTERNYQIRQTHGMLEESHIYGNVCISDCSFIKHGNTVQNSINLDPTDPSSSHTITPLCYSVEALKSVRFARCFFGNRNT